jgi:hypothetical protein
LRDRAYPQAGARLLRWLLGGVLLLTLGAALYLTSLGLGLWDDASSIRVKGLGDEEQEIAWIDEATTTDAWAQLTAAVTRLEVDWPQLEGARGTLKLDMGHDAVWAFPPLSGDVAEFALYFTEAPARKLWVRWYKISSDCPTEKWVEKLRRGPRRPPLAIIGGGSSDRALELAHLLQAHRDGWPRGKAPLLLITTATADTEVPPAQDRPPGEPLTAIYRDADASRTFRFCFTNSAMVRAVLGFLHENPQVWVDPSTAPAAASAGAVAVGAGGAPWAMLGFLQASGPKLYSVRWQDDSYSRDLESRFRAQCNDWHPFATQQDVGALPYSTGDVNQPNFAEMISVQLLLDLHAPPPRSVLALPASADRMRRYLAFLCRQSPPAARRLVLVSGDSINFNNVYRDREFDWNVLDLPVPLVFFAHRNPIDRQAALTWSFDWQRDEKDKKSTTGTHDLLLFRDIIEALLHAAFAEGRLIGDTDLVRERLRQSCWRAAPEGADPDDYRYDRVQNRLVHADAPGAAGSRPDLFDRDGNRRLGTGEHIVCLNPQFQGDRIVTLQPCMIAVFRRAALSETPTWKVRATASPPYKP